MHRSCAASSRSGRMLNVSAAGAGAGASASGECRLLCFCNSKQKHVYSPLFRTIRLRTSGYHNTFQSRMYKKSIRFTRVGEPVKSHASDADFGVAYNDSEEKQMDSSVLANKPQSEGVSDPVKQKGVLRFIRSLAGILIIVTIVATSVTVVSGGPTALIAAISKSGFTAAFTLIFVSEIGDKTFFIAALLAMQYTKGLVLLGSMAALALMTIISVWIGIMFQCIPRQFQTTLPIGKYAAVALLIVFGLKSIRDAMEIPPESGENDGNRAELGELVEAEELVKAKVSTKLSSPAEILWKSFSLVFFAEWGDRSMLATIALGAAQSPWGVATGAIGGHLVATSLAVLGGSFLARYISEKVVGYVGGILFMAFAVATLFGAY